MNLQHPILAVAGNGSLSGFAGFTLLLRDYGKRSIFAAKARLILNCLRGASIYRRLFFNKQKGRRVMQRRCFLITPFLAFLLFTLSNTVLAGSFRDDFAVVFIDAASEAKFGPFPFDRSIEAKAMRQAGELGAKGVVMKFFLDQPKEQAGDLSFAAALTNLPVLLQACLNDSEPHPNLLPRRFTVPGVSTRTEISGLRGWIPLPMFSVNARDVGFVDFGSTQVPLWETYQSQTVKSLVVCCIELATGTRAIIAPDGRMMFGAGGLRMDARNCVTAKLPAKDALAYIPFNEFLKGALPARRIKGKIVIIGYDGPHIQSISTSIGPIRAHRFFV